MRVADIELIEGTPVRAFKKIEPVWTSDPTMEGAIKKLRQIAARLHADAIMEFQSGLIPNQQTISVPSKTPPTTPQTGVVISNKTLIAQAYGWAIRWERVPEANDAKPEENGGDVPIIDVTPDELPPSAKKKKSSVPHNPLMPPGVDVVE